MTSRQSTRTTAVDQASADPVAQASYEPTGRAPRVESWSTRGMIAGAVVIAVAAVACVGYVRPHRDRAKAAATKTSSAAAKRPLPEGMSEQDVVKWVPLRQPSGRTELAPWTSVDAQLVKDPTVLDSLLRPADNSSSASQHEQPREESPSPEAGSPVATASPHAKPAEAPVAGEKGASPPPRERVAG